jgi:hypothetical protein
MAVFIPEVSRHPDVFLSHSSKDKSFVRKLADDLNVCEVDVWFDEWEIELGDSIVQSISKGLDKSKFVAPIISKSFLDSKWATEEFQSALTRQIETGSKVVLPLLIEKVELPNLLRDKLYLPFYENYYESLNKFAGLIHGLSLKAIMAGIAAINPKSLEDVLDALAYCGKDPYMIIPKDVFDEIAMTGKAEVDGERLRFPSGGIYGFDNLSERARKYITRVRIGISRDHRNQIQ